MPFWVNNIDVTVAANTIFGITSAVLSGLVSTKILEDPLTAVGDSFVAALKISGDFCYVIALKEKHNYEDNMKYNIGWIPRELYRGS